MPTRQLAALLLALPLATAVRAQGSAAPPAWARAVDSVVTAELTRSGTPGAQIAVVQRGRVVYARAYGVADIESGRPITERTLFLTGSITKPLTAALLVQLADEGKLDLDAPISRWVPELGGRMFGPATTHQLLTHSSGLGSTAILNGRTDDVALRDAMIALTDANALAEPGRVLSFSNYGYALAGHVAERVTGQSYATLIDSLVLRRLGMPRATARPFVAVTYDFSLGHVPDRGTPRVLRPLPAVASAAPAGLVWASAPEIARLAIALMSGGMLDGARVLPANAVQRMTTGHLAVPGTTHDHLGYGLHVDRVDGRRIWSKASEIQGYPGLLAMWPDDSLAVVVFANRRGYEPANVISPVVRAVAGIPLTAAVAPPPDRDPTAAERAQLAGRYNRAVPMVLIDSAGALLMQFPRVAPIPMLMSADGTRLVMSRSDGVRRAFVIVREPDGAVRYLFDDGEQAYVRQR